MLLRNAACSGLVLVSALALGCGEEVGSCDDPSKGHDTVLVGTTIQYGGQAIINESCAGCHGSQVRGAARRGAPAGLDFDLIPAESEEVGENQDGDTVMVLEEGVVRGLRERQRRVFEQRNLIWDQVKEGLMPPNGVGAAYRQLKRVFDTKDDDVCTKRKASYDGVFEKSSMDVLRNWLACGAPIVETNSESVEKAGIPGAAGFQYPLCEAAPSMPGEPIPFDTVYETVFPRCTGCHSGISSPDLGTADKAYAVLVESGEEQCQTKPYVTPGEVAGSYFYDVVNEENPACTPMGRMPPGAELTKSELKLISDWIASGAER